MTEQAYMRKLLALVMLLVGGFLVGEHIVVWGGTDIYDIIGHEWYGILLFIGGWLIVARRKDKSWLISLKR